MNGTVKAIKSDKGFGFIKSGDEEYFFHKSAFNGHWSDLVEDFEHGIEIKVVFETEPNPKGLRARNVYLESDYNGAFSYGGTE